jgi:hypothetical protein
MFEEFSLFEAGRRLDAFAFNPTSYHVAGFELKENRADFLRELADPHKADEGSAYCDAWLLVAPRGVVLPSDALPPDWGHLELRGERLFTIKHAREVVAVPFSRAICARMLANVKYATERARSEARWGFEETVRKEVEERHEHELNRVKSGKHEELTRLKERLKEFEAASGITIDAWSGARTTGEMVKALQAAEKLPDLQYVEDRAAAALEGIRNARAAIAKTEATAVAMSA